MFIFARILSRLTLRAQVLRWRREREPVAGGLGAASAAHGASAASSARPELRIRLASRAEVPYVRAAIRFIYTGHLGEQAGACAAELLRVRRFALQLQIGGCVEACEAAILRLVAHGGSGKGGKGPLAGVEELFSVRHLLAEKPGGADSGATGSSPAADGCPPAAAKGGAAPAGFAAAATSWDPFVARVLAACRQQLTEHCGAALVALKAAAAAGAAATAAAAAVLAGLGELLAWAFRDAPSLLSCPVGRRQLAALPAAALEALLRCEAFGTDSEASVLLALAVWVEANGGCAVRESIRRRLCRQVRLSHLSTPYLHALLPRLPWFPISREEHAFLCQYVAAGAERDAPARRKALAAVAYGKYDCTSPWYAAPPRPAGRSDAGRPYEWSVKQEDLAADLDGALHRLPHGLSGCFANGASRLVAHGFEWYPGTLWIRADGTPEAVVCCAVPTVLAAYTSSKDVIGLASAAARLTVYRWRERPDGGRHGDGRDGRSGRVREEASRTECSLESLMGVQGGGGGGTGAAEGGSGSWRLTLFGAGLEKGPGAAERLLPGLAPFLRGGRLGGALTFL
ncbi:hypothetical protein GPECTOR_11g24 [Gonium pectorale]|uniref:BACK domain-containing protein n=1 Tax=Gonium pectorale TaxID=33097 RepID=A0A150GPN8_GONPE|nr:hypothetical protein GPECTOR_11g24 [Gonium pectorale]|eukprot:KXZ51797.1 hypothetical protein GPECTOR_11g24 [Gonium pectorale]